MRSFLALILVLLSWFIGPVWSQNRTTLLPVSTVSQLVSGSRIPVSTVFSTSTIVSATTPTATSTSLPTVTLETKLDPAFGVLGAILILTGLPSAFWGHKNRWSSFFLIGFYTLSLVSVSLILKFGVLAAINPPSPTLRGLFVLSSCVAGIVGGGITIFFWKGTKFFIGAWGGFAVGLFIQAMHDGGLVKPIGLRWILYVGCTVVGFVLCTFTRIHYHVLLAATAAVGASAFILGVDCFTTAGLKEFYVYNLGFRALFPKYAEIDFPISQTMQIELGMIGAVTIMGMAVQARVLFVLQARLREITLEQEKRNAEVEARAAVRFNNIDKELQLWELEHGKRIGTNPTRLPDLEASTSTVVPESGRPSSQYSAFNPFSGGKRRSSGTIGDVNTGPITPVDEKARAPSLALDLGDSVAKSMPAGLVSTESKLMDQAMEKDPELKKKVELLNEIVEIRRTIQALKSEDVTSKVGSSQTFKPQIGRVANDLQSPSSSSFRRARMDESRQRARSMDILSPFSGASYSTPMETTATVNSAKSTPALDEWDEYVNSRKLFQPPSGVTPPIPAASKKHRPHSVGVSTALSEAIDQRLRKENAYELGGPAAYLETGPRAAGSSRPKTGTFGSFFRGISGSINADDEDIPLAQQLRSGSRSRTSSQPLTILPPQKSFALAPLEPVVKTFEELSSRHREKMRAMQDPLSKKEAKNAEVNAAKARWDRSLAIEREVMSKRQVEKQKGSSQKPVNFETADENHRHSRSISMEALQTSGLAKRPPPRSLKVQGWQKYQEESVNDQTRAPDLPNTERAPQHRRSGSSSPLPFPPRSRLTSDPAIGRISPQDPVF